MYTQKREQVKKINRDLDAEVARKEFALEEQLREKVAKRETI